MLSQLFFKPLMVALLLGLSALPGMATLVHAAPDHSVSLDFGNLGAGLSYAHNTHWHLRQDDQLQWRFMVAGIGASLDGSGSREKMAGIEYQDYDTQLFAAQAGMDWYPFADGWARQFYVAGGVMYIDREIKGKADLEQSFDVGGQTVNPGDIDRLEAKITQSNLQPYLSVGWGNRLGSSSGFAFRAEFGVTAATSDPEAKLTVVSADAVVSKQALEREQKALEDDTDDVNGFAMLSVAYQF